MIGTAGGVRTSTDKGGIWMKNVKMKNEPFGWVNHEW